MSGTILEEMEDVKPLHATATILHSSSSNMDPAEARFTEFCKVLFLFLCLIGSFILIAFLFFKIRFPVN